jgi:hypothetical protein
VPPTPPALLSPEAPYAAEPPAPLAVKSVGAFEHPKRLTESSEYDEEKKRETFIGSSEWLWCGARLRANETRVGFSVFQS